MTKSASRVRKRSSKLATRRDFLKGAGLAGLGVGATIVAGPRLARAEEGVVHLNSDDATDPVEALQAAVDAGGTVFLHGSWQLGQLDRIEVGGEGKDVEIIGVDGAEVVGGTWTFLAVRPVRWAVRDLCITGACGTAIGMRTSCDLTVQGCTITGIVPQLVGSPGPDGSDFGPDGVQPAPDWYWSIPVCVAPAEAAPDEPPRPFYGSGRFFGNPQAVSGRVEIRDNLIDAGVFPPSSCSMGILIARSSASCIVVGNTVRNAWFSSIMVIESPGANEIADNTLEPAVGLFGVGIWLVAWWGYPVGNTAISRNVITCGPGAFMAIGYGNFVDWDNPAYSGAEHPVVVVTSNVARMAGCDPAIVVLHGLVKNTVWARNRLSGAASGAFSVWNGGGAAGEGNVFQANNVDGVDLSPGGVHFFFDSLSSGNTVVGSSEVVTDLGTDNTITGDDVDERPMSPEVGEAISAAIARLHELRDL